MSESVAISPGASREVIYKEIAPQIAALVHGETDVIANLANVAAVLKEAFGFFWVGFYLAKGGELVLGPFQGPLACTRIKFTEGVCGKAFSDKKTIIVPDVDAFPGHIACSSASRSEIVVPILGSCGKAIGVLDVDSDRLDDFDEVDRRGLQEIVTMIERVMPSHTNLATTQ
ncbi:MAG: GAF domain-containing protein [Acidobacteria bacterium]|nr:GAF domain-containing protein [Acidobacteriota bacterium]